MNELTNEKVMTVAEVATAMGVSKRTIINCVNRLYSDKMENGKTTYLNEKEVAMISKELKNNTNVIQQISVKGKVYSVYFYKNIDTGLIKIGKAYNVKKRISTIQTIGGVINGKIVAVVKGDYEAYFHELNRDYRIQGEWFNITDGHALSQISSLEKKLDKNITVTAGVTVEKGEK